jgi:hypothetical protein
MSHGGIKKLSDDEIHKIQEQYRKSLFQTKYGVTYGHRENDPTNPKVEHLEKFRNNVAKAVLNEKTLKYFDTWVTLKDDSKYVNLILRAL